VTLAVRFDQTQEISGLVKHPSGFLTAPVCLGKVGILEYLDRRTGNLRKELVLPGTLNDEESNKSFEGVPVTNEHPPKLLDPTCARDYQVGMVHKDSEFADGKLMGSITITDAKTISDIESRKKIQVSPGYQCEVVEEPGVWEGKPYDAIQKNRVYNHLAIVTRGRAGADVAVKMDGYFLEAIGMTKIKIKGVEYEVSEPVASVLTTKFDEDMSSEEDLKKKYDELQKVCDEACAQRDEYKSKIDALITLNGPGPNEKMDAAINERMEVLAKAKAVAPEVKFDSTEKVAVMKKVLLVKAPELKDRLDGLSADYIQARFDAIYEMAGKEKVAQQGADLASTPNRMDSVSADEARKAAIRAQINARVKK